MVELSHGTFRLVLLTPQGTSLDCRAGNLVLPTHDGSRGFLRNHCPMLCKLGMGIMKVKEIQSQPDSFFFINGGFARISENNITVLTEEVITYQQMDSQQAADLLRRVQSLVAGSEYIRTQTKDQMSHRKAELLVKLAELSGITDEKNA